MKTFYELTQLQHTQEQYRQRRVLITAALVGAVIGAILAAAIVFFASMGPHAKIIIGLVLFTAGGIALWRLDRSSHRCPQCRTQMRRGSGFWDAPLFWMIALCDPLPRYCPQCGYQEGPLPRGSRGVRFRSDGMRARRAA